VIILQEAVILLSVDPLSGIMLREREISLSEILVSMQERTGIVSLSEHELLRTAHEAGKISVSVPQPSQIL
jgi:ABC-type uncharacterized transport system ATPase subunit